MIAEGSDWCWWYGPEHESSNREEFDQLYRSHLANVYRFLNLSPPEKLSRPILRTATPEVQSPPSGPITPTIDGCVTSYFEWIGAGTAMEAKLTVQAMDGGPPSYLSIAFSQGSAAISEARLAVASRQVECAFARILEARIPLASLAIPAGGGLRFQFSLWQGGLPMDAIPQQGWLEMRTTDPVEMAG